MDIVFAPWQRSYCNIDMGVLNLLLGFNYWNPRSISFTKTNAFLKNCAEAKYNSASCDRQCHVTDKYLFIY